MQKSQVKRDIRGYSGEGKSGPPPHVGIRFDETGRFLRERGNTIVSHVVAGSRSQDALLEIRDRMMALPHADHFAFTAPGSLHMTLAQGVLETRRKERYWPQGFDLGAPVDDITATYMERFAGFPDHGGFNVRVDAMTPLGLVVCGATDEDEDTMRRWRDEVCEPFGYRHPDHDAYEFHITIAYLAKWLPPEAVNLYEVALEEMLDHLDRTNPLLELDQPALCSFEDMNHFELLLYLR
ncbi:MAG: DUF1868 domain-containing protein [Hyphomicrobiales bacterium]|nr:DUF1868 domain-containing protein [Hyphomicrobiales bacterium]MCP5001567.1 DUF1868 domain-containing protein [Hyphomicrobiales bacterium]